MMIKEIKRRHPRLWCILFFAIALPIVPLAMMFDIVVGIVDELLSKIHELMVDNLFVRIIRREYRTAKKYMACAMSDVVEQWKGHDNERND